jgi:hypothetical protein
LLIEDLGTKIDLKDADVEFKTGHFLKIFIICFLYYTGMGPFVCIFSLFDGWNLTLYHNLGFTWKGSGRAVKLV